MTERSPDREVAAGFEAALFKWLSGLPALTRMVHIFYDKYVPQDSLLQPLFAHIQPDYPGRVIWRDPWKS